MQLISGKPVMLPSSRNWWKQAPRKAPVTSDESMSEAIRIELGERKAKFLPGNMKALQAGKDAANAQ